MKLHTSIAVLIILLISAGSLPAQTQTQQEDSDKNQRYLYEWTDENGTVHIGDDLGDVPEQYRRQVRKRAARPSERETRQGVPSGAAPPARPGPKSENEAHKAEWQKRLGEWKQRLANAGKRYQQLEQEKTKLLGSWNTRSSVPPANMARVEWIEQEMKQVQKEMDDARNMIDVVIPDEARKAGIPPGWLRE